MGFDPISFARSSGVQYDVDKLKESVNQRFSNVDDRFTALDARLENIEHALQKLLPTPQVQEAQPQGMVAPQPSITLNTTQPAVR